MAKMVVPYSCSSCIHLQKEDPIISGQKALYRCTSQRRNGRCVGWVEAKHPDKGIRTMGGSCCNRVYPGDKLECVTIFKTVVRMLYLGKAGDKYICYMYYSSKQLTDDRYRVYDAWRPIRDMFRMIKVIPQNPEQLKASKRMARKRKVKWLEKNGRE